MSIFKFFSLLLFITACSVNKDIRTSQGDGSRQVFADVSFENGFALTPTDPKTVRQGGGFEKTYLDTLDFGMKSPRPIWQVAQWHSKYNLANSKSKIDKSGCLVYTNEGDSRRFGKCKDGSLLLEVNASKEYDKPRVKGEQWPHLLISQRFRERSPNVGTTDKMIFSFAIRILHCENKMMAETFDRSLHTAHTPLFFIVRNTNKESKDYNQSIWFGLPSFDYREDKFNDNEKIHWDIGTAKYIYSVAPRTVWGDVRLGDGQWHKTQLDLKPLILKGLEAMKSKNVFLNTTPQDLSVTEMNFGWEVPGIFDAAVQIKELSLLAFE